MTDPNPIYAALSADFPRDQVSWRAQSVTKEGDKAMALAYIDARDVMDRLDAVLGPDNWSDGYDVHANVTICTIAVRVNEAWVSKADGAGDTDVEAEKGRISDAFKRAAVKWGIGRYLYAMPAPWVPCDSYQVERNGKPVNVWKRWKSDPWEHVKMTDRSPLGRPVVELATSAAQPHWTATAEALKLCTTVKQLNGEWTRHQPVTDLLPEHFREELKQLYFEIRDGLEPKPAKVAPNFDKLDEKPFPGDLP